MTLKRSAALSFGIVASILLGICTTLYVFAFRDAQLGPWPTISVATIIGGHFAAGFMWDWPGWEYSALMISVFLCFAAVGPGRFSIDGVLFGQRRLFGIRIA